MTFWLQDHCDFEESINNEIWSHSLEVQEHIQPFHRDWPLGSIGAQQAMRFPHRLAWVPDPLGRDWERRDALLIVGSAYGSFITGNGFRREIDPSDYESRSCSEFGKLFLEKVINRRHYYTEVENLALAVVDSCRSIAILDLCRVAFVRRITNNEKSGDDVVREAPQLFSQYVESRIPNAWLWQRVIESNANTILALGTIAEHGILRLFARNLSDARISDSKDPRILFNCIRNDDQWPRKYANNCRKLKDRKALSPPPYWLVEGRTITGKQRTWSVAVAPHPGTWRTYGTYPGDALRAAYRTR